MIFLLIFGRIWWCYSNEWVNLIKNDDNLKIIIDSYPKYDVSKIIDISLKFYFTHVNTLEIIVELWNNMFNIKFSLEFLKSTGIWLFIQIYLQNRKLCQRTWSKEFIPGLFTFLLQK